jgi:hypothetical protein
LDLCWVVACPHRHGNTQTHSSPGCDYSKISRMSVVVLYTRIYSASCHCRYLLPCLAGASIAFAALVFGYICLEETKGLKDKKAAMARSPSPRSYCTSRVEDRTRVASSTSITSSSFPGTLVGDEEECSSSKPARLSVNPNPSASPSALELLRHPPLQRVVISSFILSVLSTSYDVVFSLLCYTPIHLGGLSRPVRSSTCSVRYILNFFTAS